MSGMNSASASSLARPLLSQFFINEPIPDPSGPERVEKIMATFTNTSRQVSRPLTYTFARSLVKTAFRQAAPPRATFVQTLLRALAAFAA